MNHGVGGGLRGSGLEGRERVCVTYYALRAHVGACVYVCVCVINALSCLNEKKWKKTWKKKNENIERKMLRRKNQLSVDENI